MNMRSPFPTRIGPGTGSLQLTNLEPATRYFHWTRRKVDPGTGVTIREPFRRTKDNSKTTEEPEENFAGVSGSRRSERIAFTLAEIVGKRHQPAYHQTAG
jgi:hypothetical protein